ncbi:MAG TPA: hypothetical protein VFT75_17415 [Nocardioidaceae bacterium]|jgi:hypothetical protein|nr:hypothetical protein [Nocardioidaceae bacterium]
MLDLEDGQHVHIVNPATGVCVYEDAVIVPRPFYSGACEVWVLLHHDSLGLFPRSWLVAG